MTCFISPKPVHTLTLHLHTNVIVDGCSSLPMSFSLSPNVWFLHAPPPSPQLLLFQSHHWSEWRRAWWRTQGTRRTKRRTTTLPHGPWGQVTPVRFALRPWAGRRGTVARLPQPPGPKHRRSSSSISSPCPSGWLLEAVRGLAQSPWRHQGILKALSSPDVPKPLWLAFETHSRPQKRVLALGSSTRLVGVIFFF